MKRLAFVCILIFCLSFPVLGGHHQMGDRWCECTPINGVCPCCGGGLLGAASNQENESLGQDASDDAEPTLELGIIRLAVLMWLNIKA